MNDGAEASSEGAAPLPAAASSPVRRDAQRRAVAVLSFAALLLVVLAVAPIIVASRARAHRRLIADTIEPARIAAGELEAAAMHRFMMRVDTSARSELARARASLSSSDEVIPRFEATLDTAAGVLGGEAPARVASFEAQIRAAIAADRAGGRPLSIALRTAAATDTMQTWLDGRIAAERAAAVAVERWDVWLPVTLVPLCLLGIIAVTFAGHEIIILGRAAQRDATALASATEAKAALLRGITHDLKNPLGAARGYTELLSEGILGEMAERPLHAVQRVHRLLSVAIETLEELTELARTESSTLAIVVTETRLDRLVAECVADHTMAARARQITLVDASEASGAVSALVVLSDPRRVRRIVENLVGNAIKYTPAGGTVTVSATQDRSRNVAAITISDTGPGIPEELRARVFDEFYRLGRHESDTARDAPGGTGIGLAISLRLARLLGGELTVADAHGGGAQFTLRIPCTPPPQVRHEATS